MHFQSRIFNSLQFNSIHFTPNNFNQIAERQRMKLLALEAKEQENLTMRNIMGKYSEEDAARNLKKQVRLKWNRVKKRTV